MTHFVHHFAKKENEWRRFVLCLLKRVNEMAKKLNEMAGKLNEMNRFVGRLGCFVELLIKKVGEMPNPVSWFTRMVNEMLYFVDEMDYFAPGFLRFAELFSDQMDPFCAISGPLDDL